MRELSEVEVESMVHWNPQGGWCGPDQGKRNGFSKEDWDRILDGKSKLLTEAEDFPHLSLTTFQSYVSRELCLRMLENPKRFKRPVVRKHVSDPHAVIIDYRERG